MSVEFSDPLHVRERGESWENGFERRRVPVTPYSIYDTDITDDILERRLDERLSPTLLTALPSPEARIATFVGAALEAGGVQIDIGDVLAGVDNQNGISEDAKKWLLEYIKGIEWWKDEAQAYVRDVFNVPKEELMIRRHEFIEATEPFENTNVLRAADIITGRYRARFDDAVVNASRVLRAMFIVPAPAPPATAP